MKIIKRNGTEIEFNPEKIQIAVSKANNEAPNESDKLTDLQIEVIAEAVTKKISQFSHTPTIEEIQDAVIHEIMRQQAYTVAQLYTEYR